MFKKADEIGIDEVISVLQQAEKAHRYAKNGLETARALKAMVDDKAALECSIETLGKNKELLAGENAAMIEKIANNQETAKLTLENADVVAAQKIAKADADALARLKKADDELEVMARSLEDGKTKLLELQRERDTVKADIRNLEEIKEKTRKQIEAGSAPAGV